MITQRLRGSLAALRRPQRSLRRRILSGNAVIAVLLLITGSIVALQVRQLVAAVHTLEDARLHVDAATSVRQQTTDLLATVTRLLPEEDAEEFSAEVASRLEALRASQQDMLFIIEEVEDQQTAAALEAVDAEVTNVVNITDTMARQAQAEQWHSVIIRVGLLNRDQQQVIDAVDDLARRVRLLEGQASTQVARAERAVIIYPALVFLLTLIFGVTLVYRVTGSITRPLERLTEGASQLAAGSFEKHVAVEGDDEIGQLAHAFNGMADQLQAHYSDLEARVATRTRALETSLHIGRRLSTILDQETLTQEVVEQIQQAFKYYHVHIYLFDVGRQYLLMAGGTGEAARTMLLRGHRLKPGQGLVGRTATRKEVTLVPDVREAKEWLPNPLLPETRAELAVPIIFSGTVLGVLDVQHDVRGGLDSSDADLLQIIAAQLAVALQNAQLMAQVQTRAARAARINAVGQRIQAATSVEQVLQAAVQELGRTLPVDRAYIELSRPKSDWEARAELSVAGGQGSVDDEG